MLAGREREAERLVAGRAGLAMADGPATVEDFEVAKRSPPRSEPTVSTTSEGLFIKGGSYTELSEAQAALRRGNGGASGCSGGSVSSYSTVYGGKSKWMPASLASTELGL